MKIYRTGWVIQCRVRGGREPPPVRPTNFKIRIFGFSVFRFCVWQAKLGVTRALKRCLRSFSCHGNHGNVRKRSKTSGFAKIFSNFFAKFSQVFRKFSQVFWGFRSCWDLPGPVRMRSDGFGCVWMHSEALGLVRKIFGKSVEKLVFRYFW